MTDSPIRVLGDRGEGAATMANAVARCLAELPHVGLATRSTRLVSLGGIGTTAEHALRGGLIRDALGQAGIEIAGTTAHDGPDALLADTGWELALVLSPWKQTLAGRLDDLTASAEATGVVDTIVRRGGRTIGVNTNSWAAQAAMETVMGGREPRTVLILGSGGSSHSVALAVRRAWPAARMIGCARSASALAQWGDRFAAETVSPEDLADRAQLVINTTTWGETDASERTSFMLDITTVLDPGNGYFDLNNRISGLQRAALDGGCTVMSGTFMQRVTNACRAALVNGSI
jgi:shikimate dehydrogenase